MNMTPVVVANAGMDPLGAPAASSVQPGFPVQQIHGAAHA